MMYYSLPYISCQSLLILLKRLVDTFFLHTSFTSTLFTILKIFLCIFVTLSTKGHKRWALFDLCTIFHSFPWCALAPTSGTVRQRKKKKRKLLQEILYWIKIIEWECKEQKHAVHGGWKAARVCDVSDLRSVCYCIMAGSTGSLRRGHCWSVSTTTSLAVTLQKSCCRPHVWWSCWPQVI